MAAESESRSEQAPAEEDVSPAATTQEPGQDDEDEVEAHVWRAQC